jgi:predicted PurR-regulated permease PerM
MEESESGGVEGVFVQAPPAQRPHFTLEQSLTSSGWRYGPPEAGGAIVLEPGDDGGMRVQLNDVALEVEEVDENSWVVRQKRHDVVPVREEGVAIDEMFNLERRVDEVIEGLVSTSNERIASLIEFAQKLVVGIVGAFVGIILTLMVAAFISIDLPRVMAFLRSLVPRKGRSGYDILVDQLDTGLAGVVRGQLLICVVNGVLTYIGLAVMQVKFSVLLAVVAGILSLIPVFGTILSTVPIVLIALTDGFMLGVGALAWVLFVHALEANFLNPKIIGSSAHIHPVIVIFALLAGESAYGLVGALLAVPTASILLTLFNFVRTKAWEQGEAHEPST